MVQFCREARGAITISVHVQPSAKKTEVVGVHGDALKVKVAAPPVDGEANDELVHFFAKFFGVARSAVTVKHGDSSRKKTLQVKGVTAAIFTELLLKQGLLTIKLG